MTFGMGLSKVRCEGILKMP